VPPPAPALRPFSPGPASPVTPEPEAAAAGPDNPDNTDKGWGDEPLATAHGGNGTSSAAVPGAALASAAGPILGAPVPDDRFEPPSDPPAEASPVTTSKEASVHADGPARTFDVATTRRRPVVFEEDDDLDVPDFLK
jgi:cell division protein FtsZ